MTTKQAMDLVIQSGVPIANIAKTIGKDPSTISKWWHGRSNLSQQTQLDVRNQIKRLKEIWNRIDLD